MPPIRTLKVTLAIHSHPFGPQLPPAISAAHAQPIVWDDVGVGQVEFKAEMPDGRQFTAARAIKPPSWRSVQEQAAFAEAALLDKLTAIPNLKVTSNVTVQAPGRRLEVDALVTYPADGPGLTLSLK